MKGTDPSEGSLPVSVSSEPRLSMAMGAKATSVQLRRLAYMAFTPFVASASFCQNCVAGCFPWTSTSKNFLLQLANSTAAQNPSPAICLLYNFIILTVDELESNVYTKIIRGVQWI